MNILNKILRDLKSYSNSQKAKDLQRFFKTGIGEYGEGDKFIGVVVPDIRKVVGLHWKDTSIRDCTNLLHSPYHEVRLCSLLILVKKFQEDKASQCEIYKAYLSNTEYINNWDLVDLSAGHIIGQYLQNKDKKVLYRIARSKNLWERRISIIATFYFIYQKDHTETLKIAKILLQDKEDLIHKAVGWMLREVGKRCSQKLLEDFLKDNYKVMPRTMLRYSIERLPENRRIMYLKGKV